MSSFLGTRAFSKRRNPKDDLDSGASEMSEVRFYTMLAVDNSTDMPTLNYEGVVFGFGDRFLIGLLASWRGYAC